MNDTIEYFTSVREIETRIEADYVFLVSLEKPRRHMKGGVIVEAARRKAAELIADETHRLATPEETDAEKSAQLVAIDAAKRKDLAKELFVAALPSLAYSVVSEPAKPAAAAPPAKK